MNEIYHNPRFPGFGVFTDDDRRVCLPTVKYFVALMRQARKEGLLSLERLIPEADTVFLKTALEMLVNGYAQEVIINVLQNYILSSSYKNTAELLKRVLILEGAAGIAAGCNPLHLRDVMLSLLGEDFYAEADRYLDN